MRYPTRLSRGGPGGEAAPREALEPQKGRCQQKGQRSTDLYETGLAVRLQQGLAKRTEIAVEHTQRESHKVQGGITHWTQMAADPKGRYTRPAVPKRQTLETNA